MGTFHCWPLYRWKFHQWCLFIDRHFVDCHFVNMAISSIAHFIDGVISSTYVLSSAISLTWLQKSDSQTWINNAKKFIVCELCKLSFRSCCILRMRKDKEKCTTTFQVCWGAFKVIPWRKQTAGTIFTNSHLQTLRFCHFKSFIFERFFTILNNIETFNIRFI